MSTSKKPPVGRRGFLKGAAGGAAALVAATSQPASAQQAADSAVAQNNIPLRNASAPVATAEKDPAPGNIEVLTADRPGSDFMVDVIKALGFEIIFANPGSSFRGLHESVINYGGNKMPEFITCCHEESSVGMGHGYAKIEGKPACILAHGTVGLQHASMAIYNAYVDRAPVFMVIGNTLDAATRRPGVEWAHSVQDAAVLVRDFTKFDDCPLSLQHFAESSVRAYKIATTPPTMPVLLVADGDLQETPMSPGEKPHNPAVPGEIVYIFATGLGPPSPSDVDTGKVFVGGSMNPPATPVDSILTGGTAANILSASLVPGLVGVYYVQFQLGAGLTTDLQAQLTIAQQAFVSNVVTFPVVAPPTASSRKAPLR